MSRRVLLFVSKKPELSPAAFREYYETKHMPIIERLAGDTFPVAHSRSYLSGPGGDGDDDGGVIGYSSDFGCDAVTEMVFRDDAHWARFEAVFLSPEVTAALAEDEQHFIAPHTVKIVHVLARDETQR